MYMDDIKILTKNDKKKLETRLQNIKIYSQDIGMDWLGFMAHKPL